MIIVVIFCGKNIDRKQSLHAHVSAAAAAAAVMVTVATSTPDTNWLEPTIPIYENLEDNDAKNDNKHDDDASVESLGRVQFKLVLQLQQPLLLQWHLSPCEGSLNNNNDKDAAATSYLTGFQCLCMVTKLCCDPLQCLLWHNIGYDAGINVKHPSHPGSNTDLLCIILHQECFNNNIT